MELYEKGLCIAIQVVEDAHFTATTIGRSFHYVPERWNEQSRSRLFTKVVLSFLQYTRH
jgi:hypothetical protein